MLAPIVKALGLVRQFNPLATAEGALSKGDNCVISRENVIEDRRGYKVDSTYAHQISSVLNFEGEVLVHRSDKIDYNDGSLNTYSGDYSEVSGEKIKGVEVNSNLMITTDRGVKVIESLDTSNALRSAGAPRTLDLSYALTSGASGFLADTFQAAYRCVLKRTDTNSNVILGYPSQRLWVINNSGADENVTLTTFLTDDMVEGDVIQVYRTEQTSGVASDSSGDEMGLIYEQTLDAADITAGSITFTDSTTDALRGATLYSSPSQEGIGQANERPPLCRDLALYKSNFTFYANTETRNRLEFSLVGTSGLSGNSLTIGGITYGFGATENIATPTAEVFASGVAATDIDNTARSLVRVINRHTSNTTVYAYYLSGPSDLPGKILIETRTVGLGSPFTIQASNSAISTMTFPNSPVSPDTSTAMTAVNERRKNGLYYSKFQQPEHVPILNYLLVGPSNKEILRVVPLRDSLIIISEDGVYRLTGEDPQSFTITRLDRTAKCKAKESVAVLSNQVFMLSTQGVVRITETDVEVISREIELLINPLLQIDSLASKTSGLAYESDRQYYLSTVSDSAQTAADITYVYNIFTRTWVRWTFGFNSAVIEEDSDKMYFSKASDDDLYVERKSLTTDDYADLDYAITLTAVGPLIVDFTFTGATPAKGWTIGQGTTTIPIVSLEPIAGGYRATLARENTTFATGAATIYQPIGFDIEWNTWTGGNAALLKQVRNACLLADDSLNRNSVTEMDFNFKSNFDGVAETVNISRPRLGWGSTWGASVWGGQSDSFGYVTYVPMNKQYCNRLYFGVTHSVALERLSVSGVSFEFEVVSEEQGL